MFLLQAVFTSAKLKPHLRGSNGGSFVPFPCPMSYILLQWWLLCPISLSHVLYSIASGELKVALVSHFPVFCPISYSLRGMVAPVSYLPVPCPISYSLGIVLPHLCNICGQTTVPGEPGTFLFYWMFQYYTFQVKSK